MATGRGERSRIRRAAARRARRVVVASPPMKSYRTHNDGELRASDAGKTEALAAEARKLGHEDVIQVTGEVAARISGMANPNMPTGEIEVIARELRVLNRAEDLPFLV